MKVFISQPMKDKTNEEIKEARSFATECIKMFFPDEEVDIIDSFFEGAPHDAKPLWFLGESFKKLADADLAYFIRGWDEYRGCKMENQAAKAYGIEVIEENVLESGDIELKRFDKNAVRIPAGFTHLPFTTNISFTGSHEISYYTSLIESRLANQYPEALVTSVCADDGCEGKNYNIAVNGTIESYSDADGIIKLTHHAEALYDDTDMEYVHVEVCINGKWYGKEENENA